MKRLIRASISNTYNYKYQNPRTVTNGYIEESFPELNRSQRKIVVDGILDWKSRYNLLYHHLDLNTSNNTVNNIILITPSAHSYLHSSSVELKLFRYYDMLIPGYMQGPKAEQLEKEMYRKLFDDIGGVDKYSVKQLVDCIAQYLDHHNIYTSEDICNCLPSTLYYVDDTDLKDIIEQANIDYNVIPGVILVDNITYDELYPKLEHERDKYHKNSYAYKSYQCILDFMDANLMDRKDIWNYWKTHRQFKSNK